MAIQASYNGWDAATRRIRGALFYKMVNSGEIKPLPACQCCGHMQLQGMTWHAEEYGPTWEEYVAGAKYLCPTCHGMIHFRFKFINRWKRYKQRVTMGTQHMPFKSLQAFFQYAKNIKDIPYYEDTPTGITWLDNLALTPYKGVPKLAYALVNGVLRPDPRIYGDQTVEQLLQLTSK